MNEPATTSLGSIVVMGDTSLMPEVLGDFREAAFCTLACMPDAAEIHVRMDFFPDGRWSGKMIDITLNGEEVV